MREQSGMTWHASGKSSECRLLGRRQLTNPKQAEKHGNARIFHVSSWITDAESSCGASTPPDMQGVREDAETMLGRKRRNGFST